MSPINQQECPYCHSPGNQSFQYNEIAYFKCRHCGLVFRDCRLDRIDHIFEEHTGDQTSGFRNPLFEAILDEISIDKQTGTLLDLGCGCGYFLKFAIDRGWQAKGVDPSFESIAYAKTFCGDSAVHGTLDDIEGDAMYDVITMINVLENIPESWNETKRALSLLKNNGLLYVRFVNGRFHQVIWKTKLPFFIRKQCIFHQYSLSVPFIRKILSGQGYTNITVRNAPIAGYLKPFFSTGKRKMNLIIRGSIGFGFTLSNLLLGDRFFLWPSAIVTARKNYE